MLPGIYLLIPKLRFNVPRLSVNDKYHALKSTIHLAEHNKYENTRCKCIFQLKEKSQRKTKFYTGFQFQNAHVYATTKSY